MEKIDFINKKLEAEFFKQTGICGINSQGEPDIDYVNWLEKKNYRITLFFVRKL